MRKGRGREGFRLRPKTGPAEERSSACNLKQLRLMRSISNTFTLTFMFLFLMRNLRPVQVIPCQNFS